VLVRVPAGEEWETIYVARVEQPLRFVEPSAAGTSPDDALRWQVQAGIGDVYPFDGLKVADDLRFKQKSGGVISKKVRGGEVFARHGEKAEDPAKGSDAVRLIAALQTLRTAGKKIGRVAVNIAGHVVFRENGQLYFVAALEKGLEFPTEDNSEGQGT
jgi:hypothetical protein